MKKSYIKLFEEWSELELDEMMRILFSKTRWHFDISDYGIYDIIVYYFKECNWFIEGLRDKLSRLPEDLILNHFYTEESERLAEIFSKADYIEQESVNDLLLDYLKE